MNATTRFRGALLEALDPLMESVGFGRRKNCFAWTRRISNDLTDSVHLNFGLYPVAGRISVLPTLGVRFASIETALIAAGVVPKEQSRDRSTVGFAMRPPTASAYEFTAADAPVVAAETLWSDLKSGPLARLETLRTLDRVVDSLSSPEPEQWGILSRSVRARVLPLALRAAGREVDALTTLAQLEGEMRDVDQLVPSFDDFAGWFRGRVA